MEYKVEMDKLTEEQLEAFRIINNAAVELELERRVRESTYEDEVEFMEDVSKAYFFLRPMYDNMRNNDTKKTITSSGIIETLEKFIRTAKANKIEYKEYESAPEKEPEQAPAPAPAPEKEPAEVAEPAGWTISDIEKPEPIPAPEPFSGPYKPVVQSKTVNDPYNPTPMPLRPLLQQESQPAQQPIPAPESQPAQQPIPAPEPQPAPQPVAQSVPQSRLNEILANIPVVGN